MNIKYVLGGMSHQYQKGIEAANTSSEINWPYVCYGEWHGHNRMKELLNQGDFTYLKGQGFDHVRLFVDPIIYGCHKNQYTVDPNSLGMEATVETIQEARAAGLKVILLCYPGAISPTAWDLGYPNNAIDFPGPFRQDLVYYPESVPAENPVSPIPLVQFWKTYVQALDNSSLDNNWMNDVVFEVMNESHEDFTWDRLEDPLIPTNGSTQAMLRKEASGRNWREVVRRCVNAIQSVGDGTARVIASTYQSCMADYVAIDDSDPQDTTYPVGFDAYNSQEVIKPMNVSYSVHLYEPFRYTHWEYKVSNPIDPTYRRGRDYFGDLDSMHDDYDDDHGTTLDMNGNPLPVPPPLGQRNLFLGDIIKAMNNIYFWRMGQGYPRIFMDEFGVKRRQPVDIWDPNNGGGPEAVPAETVESLAMRSRWTFDARKTAENMGFGWTIFEYVGQFGVMDGELSNRNKFHYNERPTNNTHGILLQKMSQGLFGNVRPD